jgi:hypothetical protein
MKLDWPRPGVKLVARSQCRLESPHTKRLGTFGCFFIDGRHHQLTSMIQLPPSLLQPLDADRLRGAQFLREEAHAQLFQ